MRKIITLAILAFSINAFAQLPPAAQVLYDSAYAHDSSIVQYAINSGAQILATPDGNSFYIKWFPTGSTPSATPVIVTLHGSEGYAFYEFYTWHSQAQLHGCGIIALQWYRGSTANPLYFDDTTIYSYLDSALTSISYPSGKAFLHGFSRGSARSYAIVFDDIQSGNNYFCTVISNSGSASPTYPLYAQINSGVYGSNVFLGKHWNLFCGGQDPDSTTSGCIGMTNTKSWLEGQGAIIDIFIQDPDLGHDGFVLQSSFAYRDSILDNYLNCYNGTVSVDENLNKNNIHVFPNPSNSSVTIQFNSEMNNAELNIYNIYGQKIITIKNSSGDRIIINKDKLQNGVYFILLTKDNKIIASDKLLITD